MSRCNGKNPGQDHEEIKLPLISTFNKCAAIGYTV